MKVADIITVLRGRYHPPEWAFLEELRAGTGHDYGYKGGVEKRLDAWAFHLWPSGGYQPTGFEIKISRSDFQRELRKADEIERFNASHPLLPTHLKKKGKTERYMALCQFFYYVTPANLILAREVPDEAGLIWAYSGRTRIVKKAPQREIPPPEWDFFAAICRRVGDAGWQKPP